LILDLRFKILDLDMTILITGGTGLVGNAVTKLAIEKGYQVIILTRDKSKTSSQKNITYANWDLERPMIDERAIREADFVIHLAGANVGEKRWSAKRKDEILKSRTDSSTLIVDSLKKIPNNVKTVISASAIGWYGEDPEIPNKHPFTEDARAAGGFLGETCKAWEESISPVEGLGKRLVILRTGIVFSREGGALEKLKMPITRFGTAPILGSGKQAISWIHEEDLARMYLHAVETESMKGAYNAVATQVTDNKRLNQLLARIYRKKFYMMVHVPAFVLKIALGEMSIEVLKSTTVSNQKVRHAGFTFLYPAAETALQNLKNEK